MIMTSTSVRYVKKTTQIKGSQIIRRIYIAATKNSLTVHIIHFHCQLYPEILLLLCFYDEHSLRIVLKFYFERNFREKNLTF